MKTLTVYNSELEPVTIVLNFDNDITIQPLQFAIIETDSAFNSDNFYVDGDNENTWTVKYNNDQTELTLYKKYIPVWND
jgi:hypothetical protein